MKRLLVVAAFAATLFTGAGTAVAAQPAPTPSPTTGTQGTPSATPTASPTGSLDPNTAEVCDKSRTTVENGISDFTEEIENAGNLAANGDLSGAEQSVKKSGTVLIDLAADLREDAASAQNPELKDALENVATELTTLGSGLTSLTSLQDFDTARLETLAERVAEICGTN